MKIIPRWSLLRAAALAVAVCLLAGLMPAALAEDRAAVKTALLTVEYRLHDPSGPLVADSYMAQLPVGERYEVPSPDLTAQGFTLQDAAQAVVSGTLTGDVEVQVLYGQDAAEWVSYTILHKSETETVLKTETGQGRHGETVSASIQNIPGYMAQGEQEDLTIVLDRDAPANTITVRYKRTDPVHLHFDTGTGGSYVPTVSGDPGELLIPPSSPARPGYTFDRWSPALPDTIPAVDTEYTALWTPATAQYNVVYMMQNTDGTTYSPMGEDAIGQVNDMLDKEWGAVAPAPQLSLIRTGKTGGAVEPEPVDRFIAEHGHTLETEGEKDLIQSAVTAIIVKKGSAYPFFGFRYSGYRVGEGEPDNEPLRGDGTTVLYIYYDRAEFSIYLHDKLSPGESDLWDPPTSGDEVWTSASGAYGARVRTLPDTAEIKAHYEALYEQANGKKATFVGLTTASGVNAPNKEYYGVRLFTRESSAGTGRLHLYPVFTEATELPLMGRVYYEDPEAPGDISRITQTGIMAQTFGRTQNSAITPTMAPHTGFTWTGGYYRVGTSLEEVSAARWEEITPNMIGKDPQRPNDLSITVTQNAAEWTGDAIYLDLCMARKTYTLSYRCSETDHANTKWEVQTYRYGQEADLPEDAQAYAPHPGQKFGGWCFSREQALAHADFTVQEMTMPAHDATLYARWIPQSMTVTFDSRGGAPAPARADVLYGAKAPRPEETPALDGFAFQGWYTAPENGELYDFNKPVEASVTLYAHWTPRDSEGACEVRHVVRGQNGKPDQVILTQRFTGIRGQSIVIRPLTPLDKDYPADLRLTAQSGIQTVRIPMTGHGNATVYYRSAPERPYAIYCLDENGGMLRTAQHKLSTYAVVTETPPSIRGYIPQETYQVLRLADGQDAVIFTYRWDGVTPLPEPPAEDGGSGGGDSHGPAADTGRGRRLRRRGQPWPRR